MAEEKRVEAVIKEAKIRKIVDLWSHKPRGLQFNDTDALIVTAETEAGKIINETFYFCLKPDGTFNIDTVSKNGSHVRRQRLASFLTHYKITDTPKSYNIKEGVEKWKGKKIEIVPYKDEGYIYIP
ncbi:MAG: hypothetical protein QMD21_00670 [Candidatus Thermoplasmatota archaeon]|nr:hypothetical protein [Candidatus Thermoplasmatota archaeon]MDI6855283.1 hypothetical protein [Candidatus Thermoplasmatota archaeon]